MFVRVFIYVCVSVRVCLCLCVWPMQFVHWIVDFIDLLRFLHFIAKGDDGLRHEDNRRCRITRDNTIAVRVDSGAKLPRSMAITARAGIRFWQRVFAQRSSQLAEGTSCCNNRRRKDPGVNRHAQFIGGHVCGQARGLPGARRERAWGLMKRVSD